MVVPLTFCDNPDHFGGARVNAKRPTILMRAAHDGIVECQLRDSAGNPIDLTQYGIPDNGSETLSQFDADNMPVQYFPTLYIPLAEVLADGDVELRVSYFETAGALAGATLAVDHLDVTTGQIRFTVPPAITAQGGIWLLEFSVVDANNGTWFLCDAFLHIARGGSFNGPPTISEMRILLRDYAQENELLDAVDFDATEITFAADMCVAEWNEADPFDGPKYSTQTFPFRRNWMIGMCGYLFGMASEHYLRNTLPYQAGGLQHDDKNKAGQYMQKAIAAKQEWQTFVTSRKLALAGQAGFSSIPGVYERGWNY